MSYGHSPQNTEVRSTHTEHTRTEVEDASDALVSHWEQRKRSEITLNSRKQLRRARNGIWEYYMYSAVWDSD